MTTTPLRVALIIDPLSMLMDQPLSLRGKWGDHAPRLARELLGRGHVVRGFGAPPGLIPRSGEDADRGVDRGEPPRSWRPWRGLGEFRPDVLVAYDALSLAAFRGARAARKLSAALVLVEAALPVGELLVETLSRIGAFLWGRYVRRTARSVVALDPTARRQALEEGFEESLLHVVPHGVDLALFRPGLTSPLVTRHRIRGRILLYVGRVAPGRGLEELLRAFAGTVGQRGDWNLVLAGDGPLRAPLGAMSERLGVADRVHWLHAPREEELPGLLGASTLFAVPARDEGVVGRHIGRAMACGLPVLASDLPRLRGLVEHDRNGLLVEPGKIEAWTAAVARAAGDPVARKRWSRSARELAEQTLDWSRVGKRFEEILRAVRAEPVTEGRARGGEAAESLRIS